MNYQDRITELNFDLDNEDAQAEALVLKKHLTKVYRISFISSILLLSLSIIAFVIMIVYAFIGNEKMILFSIIPLVTILIGGFLFIFSLNRKSLAEEIIIEKMDE